MSETTEPTEPTPAPAAEPVAAPAAQPAAAPAAQPAAPARPARTVTLPLIPLAIVGAVIVALLCFGGGVAIGLGIGGHEDRVSRVEPFRNGQNGSGNGYGFNNRDQGGAGNGVPGQRPTGRPTEAPSNG